MYEILLATVLAVSSPVGEVLRAESITVCHEEKTAEVVLDTFEEGGFASMIGVLQMFSSLGLCYQYEGVFTMHYTGMERSHGTLVVTANPALDAEGTPMYVFRVKEAI